MMELVGNWLTGVTAAAILCALANSLMPDGPVRRVGRLACGLAVLAAVLAGMLAGLATGVLHTACGIPAILAGILTQLALYSINLRIMAIGDENATTKATLAVSVDKNDLLLSSRYVREPALNNPLLLLVLLTAAVIALLYWFFGTEQGSALRATGANQSMARAQGINTNTAKVLGLVVSNGLVALSGALLCQYQGYADINMGRGAVVIGLAAVVIGEAVVKHISPNFAVRLTGVLVGAVIYYLVYQVIIFVGFDTDLLKMFSALVVAVFLGVPYVKKQLARKHRVKGGIRHA